MLKSFDANYNIWDIYSNILTNRNFDIDRISYIHNIIKTSNYIKVNRRIGTKSMDAEVYEIEIDDVKLANIKFACKVIPIINATNNLNEITIAKEASNLVLEGKCKYFPIVYGNLECQNVYFNDESLFKNPSIEWNIKNQIVNLSKLNKRFVNLSIDELLNRTSINKELIDYNPELPADLLISELAWGDLKSLVEKYPNLNKKVWKDIINMIFEAIKALQEHLNVVHNDLHFGNILFTSSNSSSNNDNSFDILIHDFGRSYKGIINEEDKIKDVMKVIESLENYKTPIDNKINKLKKFINEGNVDINKIIKFFNS